MNLTVKYFGLLAEVTECNEEQLDFSGATVKELLENLFSKYPDLKEKDFQVAQNNTIVDKSEPINQTEIALLPPFSGG